MLPKGEDMVDLQQRINAVLLELDRLDPRLHEIERILSDTWYKAQKIRPYDDDFAHRESIKAAIQYISRFPEFNYKMQKENDTSPKSPPKLVRPEGITLYANTIQTPKAKSIVLPQPKLILAPSNKPLQEIVEPYIVAAQKGAVSLADGSNYIGLLSR